MIRRPLTLVLLAAALGPSLAAAVPPARTLAHAPARASLNAPHAAAKTALRKAQQAAPAATARRSTLPPTAPTTLKTPQTAAAAPNATQTTLLAQAADPRLPTPAQIRAQAAPRDAAPLAPPASPAAATPARPPTRPTAAPQRTTAKPAAPTPAAPKPAAQPTATSKPATPPKADRLPPGPLTTSPARIATSPNDLRITGLGTSSTPWSIVLLLTLLSVIPAILICITPFARLLVVFHFLRQALGLQTTPSNQTLIGLTLILTFFIMEPVGKQIYEQSLIPLQDGKITAFEALARGKDPLREFMVHFVREKDAELFLEIAHEPRPHDIRDLSMRVLVPAYIVSELKAGFQIGAVLFLPFLVVDMVVASITTSVGMMQLPPVVISTPLKLFLFLMVDGWHLLIGALVRSFN